MQVGSPGGSRASLGFVTPPNFPNDFPNDFVWGAATASYQIEGAVGEDGRGESIWDRFSHTPGRVEGGHTGDVACDHYHRVPEDVALMKGLGLTGYRFSIGWPRVIPLGRGPVNGKGLGFYDRLVDELLAAGITPFPTLYHWDLPQTLEDEGGWANRPTAEAFAEYAEVVAGRLGDRVRYWMTLNEPWVSAHLGYAVGEHAPGRTSLEDSLAAAHHLLLAHGLAVPRIRAVVPAAEVGIVLNLHPVHPVSAHSEDQAAATALDGTVNRWYLDPLAGRGYPSDAQAFLGWKAGPVEPGDLETIAAPIDQLGVNYYFRHLERSGEVSDRERPAPLVASTGELTGMGWEVYPDGMYEMLTRLHADYPFPALYITENGAAYPEPDHLEDPPDDADRISYLDRHLGAAARAIGDGVPLRGYFVWSLFDNFEWALGYTKRFGIIHVDYDSLVRTPKASYRWYRDLINRQRRLPFPG